MLDLANDATAILDGDVRSLANDVCLALLESQYIRSTLLDRRSWKSTWGLAWVSNIVGPSQMLHYTIEWKGGHSTLASWQSLRPIDMNGSGITFGFGMQS